MTFKSGFVAILGRPNVGKSTFLNHVMGQKIAIMSDKAREQAEEYGHSFEREMGFLAVHGFLHINGYDHYTPEEEKEMFGLQEEILTAYGLTRQ